MVIRIAGAMMFVVMFNLVALGGLLALSPAAGLVWAVVFGGGFLWWYLRSGDGAAGRRARIRIRPPTGTRALIAAAAVATLVLAFGVSAFIEALGPAMDELDLGGWERIIAYQSSPGGWVALTVLIALVIPVVEEFMFRGHIQGALERRFGPVVAIPVAAVLFMACHVGGPHWSIMLISLTLGLCMGTAVYLFDSIWVGVAIHALWNATMASLGAGSTAVDATTFGPVPPAALLPAAAFLTLTGLTAWLLILRAQGRAPRAARLNA